MKNKAFFVKRLCDLKGIPQESEECQKLYELKVVDLLIQIKNNTPVSVKPEPEDEEDSSLAARLGCCN